MAEGHGIDGASGGVISRTVFLSYASQDTEVANTVCRDSVIVGSVEIIDCHEDAEGFAWELASPARYFKPLVPHDVSQPGFWYPTF
jgi:hypothetical protein